MYATSTTIECGELSALDLPELHASFKAYNDKTLLSPAAHHGCMIRIAYLSKRYSLQAITLPLSSVKQALVVAQASAHFYFLSG